MEIIDKIDEIWKSYNITTSADLDKYLHDFRILFAYNSGRIENVEITYNDTREIFENGKVVCFTGNPRTLFEQQNQRLCYEILKDKIISKEPVTLELIIEIHKVLTSGTYDERRYIENQERPGEFKKHDYIIGINQVGSAVENVAKDLSELILETSAYSGKDVLKAAAYLHARFEFIHPFADGNGRVGRTLMNYYLMINDYPPLVIYDEDKQLYYECLRKYDEFEEISPLYEFLKYETEKTWQKTLELADGMDHKHKPLSDFI
ncbi:MAG: Fic family protein [Saccharofermentanales bacterium]